MLASMKLWSELREKMAGRRAMTALGTLDIASAANYIVWLLKVLSTGKGIENLQKIEDTADWLNLYRDHARLQNVLMRGMHPEWSWAIEATALLRGMRAAMCWLRAMSEEERRAWIAENKAALDETWGSLRP